MSDNKKWALMLSDEPGKQCDIFPNRSIHELDTNSGVKNKVAGRVDFIPENYPFLLLDEKPQTKKCASCNNEFELTEEFISDEGKESCVRCITRLYVPARIREQMVAVIQKADKAELQILLNHYTEKSIELLESGQRVKRLEVENHTLRNRAERHMNKILRLLEVKKVKTERIISLRRELLQLIQKNG